MDTFRTIFVPGSHEKNQTRGPNMNGEDTARLIQNAIEEQARAGYALQHMQPVVNTSGSAYTFTEGFILVFGLA
jgi:hypothetical protein